MNLRYLLVAYPVRLKTMDLSEKWMQKGKGQSFFVDVEPISRAFGVFGHRGFRGNKTWQAESGQNHVHKGWLYQIPGAITLGLVAWDVSSLSKAQTANLDHPNVASTRELLQKLGLETVDASFTISISLEYDDDLAQSEWRRFRLLVPVRTDAHFVDQVLWRMLGAIAIERHLLDDATRFLSRRVLSARVARRHLANINGWIANPAIENPEIASLYQQGRESHKLDARAAELEKALSAISRRGNESAIAGASATALGLTATSTGVFQFVDPLVPVIGSLAFGAAAWLWSRGTR